MNPQIEKSIKKFNKIYVIELFAIAAVIIALATLKLIGIIGKSQNFRHIFNIITLIAATWMIIDLVWLIKSKRRQRRNSWFDKITVIPFAIFLIVFDIICLIHWQDENLSYFSLTVAIAFYYVSAVYIAQGIYHIRHPHPSIVEAAMDEYKEQQKIQKESENKQVDDKIEK